MNKQVKATAKVQVTLEVKLTDNWGPDCPVQQIMHQGADAALVILAQLIANQRNVTIASVPKVIAVLVEEER